MDSFFGTKMPTYLMIILQMPILNRLIAGDN